MSLKECFFNIEVKALEDLHSSTGTGDGVLDSIQITDRFGKPTVRYSHLKGVMLDEATELVEMGAIAEKDMQALFGQKGPGGQALLSGISLRTTGTAPDTVEWTSTAREELSRTPKTDTLRIANYMAAGTKLQGMLHLKDKQLADTLKTIIKHTCALGSRRNRGTGAVTIQTNETLPSLVSIEPPKSGQKRLCIVIKNLDPLRFPVTGMPGNIIPTDGFIRGQRLTGALSEWLVNRGEDPGPLLSGRRISVGDGLPLPSTMDGSKPPSDLSQWRVQPLPLNIGSPKPSAQTSSRASWWATPGADQQQRLLDSGHDTIMPWPGQAPPPGQLKRPKAHEYLLRTDTGESWRYQPSIRVHMRNRTPHRGENAALFSEEEIAEHTLFLAELEFSRDEDAQWFHEHFEDLLNGQSWLPLGRGRSPCEIQSALWASDTPWQSDAPSERLNITLRSNLIADDAMMCGYTRWSLDVLIATHILSTEEAREWQHKGELKVIGERSDSEIIHGFNSVSGLPKLPRQSIRRGSILCLEGSKSGELHSRLMQQTALGERKAEGFGRFDLSELTITNPEHSAPDQTTLNHNHLEDMLTQAHALLAELLNIPIGRGETPPGLSQWNRVHALIAMGETANTVITDLATKSAKLSGRNWKPFIKTLNTEIDKETDSKRQSLLLGLVARLFILRLKKTAKEQEQRP